MCIKLHYVYLITVDFTVMLYFDDCQNLEHVDQVSTQDSFGFRHNV